MTETNGARAASGPLRHLPNAISIARLALVPVLGYLIAVGAATAYTAVLIAALISDAADGFLARRLNACTRLGAVLDSTADTLVMGTAVIAIWVFHPYVYTEHWLPIAATVVFATLEHLAALARYGRPSGFHTPLARLGIQLYSAFVVTLFVLDFYPWLLYTAAAVSVVAMWEQLAMVALLARWSPDTRGGIVEALRISRTKGERSGTNTNG